MKEFNKEQRNKERASVSGIAITPEGLSDVVNKEIQAWNEYLRKYGNFRENYKRQKNITTKELEKLQLRETEKG